MPLREVLFGVSVATLVPTTLVGTTLATSFHIVETVLGTRLHTTNAIESLHMQLRKIIKARGHFPSGEAALKLIWLALRNVVAKWTGSRHDWKSAMTQFALLYPERFNIGV
ncbi:transposase [Burkholderia sp. MSMB1826]|uniref:transposase n=1 Tax=Burkholderia sp. MSMB1826 TaxID=1637875 RepID=UPI0027B90923|nr:transposase [Burkholderia sp. MSMB1826]